MEEDRNDRNSEGKRVKVYCANARCLTEEEVQALPEDKRKQMEESGGKGLWMEFFCPDESCLREEERIDLPVRMVADEKKKGMWLNLFCPEDRCVIDDETDLP